MDTEDHSPVFKRILLKISGEALMGPLGFGLHSSTIESICRQVKEIKDLGVEIGIVVGGGNIFRGLNAGERGMDRVTADNMGMMATVINSLAMMDTLEQMGIFTRVMSAVKIEAFAEEYIRRRAVRHVEKGRLVIFAAGIGRPYFSTDTAASLRAVEIGADVLIKATKITAHVFNVSLKTSYVSRNINCQSSKSCHLSNLHFISSKALQTILHVLFYARPISSLFNFFILNPKECYPF